MGKYDKSTVQKKTTSLMDKFVLLPRERFWKQHIQLHSSKHLPH